ncbi:MAG: LysR family transcriptional regulator [Gammaproteobacteria bacterium]|nr:LysR family transcriptional regulator [Gammaproteobacteria bacterium]
MNTTDLKTFVTIAECGSFSKAASLLHLTQPAISKRISSLEQSLNIRLFDRIARKTKLTEAGQMLLQRAQKILLDLEDTRRLITNISSHVGGKLSLGISHHIGLHRLPPILKQYTQQYPDVKLDLKFIDSEAACQAVEKNELEIAVVTLPNQPSNSLKLLPVWQDSLAFVTAPGFPLQHATPQTLAAHPAILPAYDTYTRDILEQQLHPFGIKLNVMLETNNLETIKMMVSIGLCWSVLPETMLDETVCVHPVEDIVITRTLGLVHHKERTLSNAANAFIKLLEKIEG